MNKYHTGFTLIEILLVVAIMTMATVIVLPHLSSGRVAILRAQVREAVAVLNYARRSAVIQGKTNVVSLYEGKEEETRPKPAPGKWVSRGASLQWGGEVEEKDAKKNSHEFTFYPEGGSSGGEIVLTYEGYQAKITINPLTGNIKSEIIDKS